MSRGGDGVSPHLVVGRITMSRLSYQRVDKMAVLSVALKVVWKEQQSAVDSVAQWAEH